MRVMCPAFRALHAWLLVAVLWCDLQPTETTLKMEIPCCAICELPLDGSPTVKLGKKGTDSIKLASSQRNDSDVNVTEGQTVHTECRRQYVHPRNLKTLDINNSQYELNSPTRSTRIFDFKNKCIFCGKNAKVSNKKRAINVYPVRTFDFQKKIREKCVERNDKWSEEVLGRITSAIDLPAADAVYHQNCNVNFRTNRDIPKRFADCEASPRKRPVGRPDSVDTSEAFITVVSHIEDNVGFVFSLSNLINIMKDQCGERAYAGNYLKKKLVDHFGETLSVNSINGKEDTFMLKQTAAELLYEAKSGNELSEQEKNQQTILEAAKVIMNDINLCTQNKKFYPVFSDVASSEENKNFVPDNLRLFLSTIFSGKDVDMKVSSIGQAIVQASRPRNIIAPLQIGLAIQLHHHFGSRYLVDLLNNLGFCASYFEVQKFESSAAASMNTNIPTFFPGKFLQFVADNADHNIATLDGNGTFHGMGIIACTTPGSQLSMPIPRTEVSSEELRRLGKIDIKYFKVPENSKLENLQFEKLEHSKEGTSEHMLDNSFDTFAKVIWTLKPSRPSWSGFMQLYDRPEDLTYPGKASITFLPMIDMNASDLSCIYSTLHFVTDQARKYQVTPVLTFDQPLFQKATNIIECCDSKSGLKHIVLRLGAFHTQMSFLGCIGHLMSGSGLQEALQTIYAPNAVTHMMTGKAVSRAVRGHFLVDTALHYQLISKSFGEVSPLESNEGPSFPNLPTDDNQNFEEEDQVKFEKSLQPADLLRDSHVSEILDDVADLYGKLQKNQISREEVCRQESFKEIQEKLNLIRNQLKQNRTASLWFQYMDMISILQQFIRAERTGNWSGHLKALQEMLPFFAASGHNHYLKSAHIYLQKMIKLEETNPYIYHQFMKGNHSIRRSDRYWAGLSTDLTIEQVLMRSLKSTGGLTRGRGMTEEQRSLWIMSMPANAEMSNAMQQFSNTTYETSDQHKDVGKARSIRDEGDTYKVLQFLRDHPPFDESDPSLRNIETGVTANEKVNVEAAKHIGQEILKNMVGKAVLSYSFKRSKQAITMNDKMSLKVTGDTIAIDPQLLFQRITAVADRYVDDLSTIFQFELCSIPSSLFDNDGLPRVPQKALLADAIWKLGDCAKTTESNSMNISTTSYVLDGGSLLQKIPWPKLGTFQSICEQYYNHILHKYPVQQTTVVFDGYSNGPSTKDITHVRRSKGSVDTVVNFTCTTPFKSKKESFLKNSANKQTFITLLGKYLSERDICVNYAPDDADRLIVECATRLAGETDTYVIGEDTDLLVLLCYHVNNSNYAVYLRSDKQNSSMKSPKVWDIRKTQTVLTSQICSLLPFLHALTGCDTTSKIHGIGKTSALKTLRKNKDLQDIASRFIASETKDEIVELGEKAILSLIDGDSRGSLNTKRFQRFASQVMRSSTYVQVQTLPPTSAAALYHSLRVYYQVQNWTSATSSILQPEDWGWELSNGVISPIKTHLPPAPDYLLNVVRCNCKSNCDTKRCSCRKHGLDCSLGCGECRGANCTNSRLLDMENDLDLHESDLMSI